MSPNVPEAEGRARKLLSSFNEQLAMGDGYFACPGCTVRSSGNAKWVREANEAHECERLRDARGVLALAALARELAEALDTVHGSEPGVNMRHGEPYVYCPLCDDKSWPCKAASTLGKARVAGLLPDRESAPAEDRGGKGCTLCNDPLPCRHSRVSGEKPEDSR